MTRAYAIGDIHGQFDLLCAAHERIEEDRARVRDAQAPVIHLGDLVDRGPDSASVIDYLIRGRAEGQPWIVLRGNHDQIFLEFLRAGREGGKADMFWLSPGMGGRETLASYGVHPGIWPRSKALVRDAAAAVPEEHVEFLESLPLTHVTATELYVHAGIRPGLPLEDQTERDLLWIRDEFLHDTRDHGRLVVHGHTPELMPTHYGNRLNLDTGAGFGRDLTVAVIEDGRVWVLDGAGRQPLDPIG